MIEKYSASKPQGDYKVACRLIRESIREANLKDNIDIFLLGNFYIIFSDKKSPATKELNTTAAIWGLKQLVTGYTRLGFIEGTLKKSCINNILTNSDQIAETAILDWNFSDHLLIVVRRKKSALTRSKVEFRGRSYKNYVKEDLQEYLLTGNWATWDPSILKRII